MKLLLFLILYSVFLAGCSSIPKQWSAIDGSRSDGTITLTYVYRPILDTKPIENNDAVDLATSKCVLWGYAGAEAFGDETKSCNTLGVDGGCTSWRVSKVYQCSSKKI
jgi:hypothetical protein